MTQEELDAIRKRADAATPGPWYGEFTVWAEAQDGSPVMEWMPRDDSVNEQNEADCTFIAHARQDIPALLDEIARLDAIRRELTETVMRLLAERE